MIRTILLLIITLNSGFSQDFNSPENRKLFADHLFCSKDYLRAVFEYEEYLKYFSDDTVIFKVALGYSKIENFNKAADQFINISPQSEFYLVSRLEYLKSKILSEDFESINRFNISDKSTDEIKLINISYLLREAILPGKDNFLNVFDEQDKNEVKMLYNYKNYPPYKSPVTAGILSALIPGSGKIYTGQISEGITSFLLNGLFAFISYNNFQNHHNVRGWIFAGVTALFYSGNIYGSAVSAQIYNAGIDYEYSERVKKYLSEKNFFIEDYDFCNE